MAKLIKWCMAIVVLAGVALVGCQALNSTHSFTVSQTQLQKLVDKNWTTMAAKLHESNVTMAAPTLKLLPDSQRIGADFDAFVETGFLGVKLDGTMSVSGIPAYDEAQGAVVLRDMKVDKFDVTNLPDMLDGVVKNQAQRMVGKKFGTDVPIYKIEADKLRFAGKTWLPEKVEVAKDHLEITLLPK
ncbi:DUF1439 domain-containing protein [Ephemeroptericola cinctiostellae]|nr:DUF1439 domain-containing protein [Ephemeroptericola cinctiostellae]